MIKKTHRAKHERTMLIERKHHYYSVKALHRLLSKLNNNLQVKIYKNNAQDIKNWALYRLY